VAERIAELRALQTEIEDVSQLGLLASLRRIIKAGESSENPTLVNAARLAILDASRLRAELAGHHAHERKHLEYVFKGLTEDELKDPAPEGASQRPSIAPRAPAHLLASAAASPLALPGLSAAASPGMPARRWA